MKHVDYWRMRFGHLEEAQARAAAKGYADIEKMYRQAQSDIESQILIWYERFAENNSITMAQARQWLKSSDLEELKWNVSEYIKYGQANAVDGKWIKQLENASAKYHISKLESLKIQTQQSLEALYANQSGTVASVLGNSYYDAYYHTAYEIQKGLNLGWGISGIDQAELENILAKPWAIDKYNFSERIWNNKTKLIAEVHNQLTQGILTGADPQKAIDAIAKKMNTSKYNAGRLVMTEEAYFSSLARKECFDELGVEKYEVVATLDSRTSEICRDLDGKVFDMKDYESGVTAPPFHVYCRSTTCPYFDDDFDSEGQRIARDENGNSYYVPEKMTYKEWAKKYVKDAMSSSDRKLYNKYSKILSQNMLSVEDFMDVRYNKSEWNLFKSYAGSIKSGELTPMADFGFYKNINSQINTSLIGQMTKNGILITHRSNHFVARIIGSAEQRRNGVAISDVLDALQNPVKIDAAVKSKRGTSQRFTGKNAAVAVNPDTGTLIQANPKRKPK